MKKIFYLLLLLAIQANAQTYHLVSIENLIEQEVGRIVMPEIYKEAGMKLTITPMPGMRASSETSSGRKDGEIMRIWSYGADHPTTVRVPTPYYKLETMAFIREESGVVVNNKSDLEKYRLVKVLGVKHTNNISAGLTKVYDVESTEKMMRFLQSGRADIALTNTVDGLLALKKLGIKDIVPASQPLAVLNLYHYLHEKNKSAVPVLDNAILKMKKNGSLSKIIEKAEETVIKGKSM